MDEVRSFCRICTAMCGVVVTVDGEQVLRVRGDREHPISAGYTCTKGRALPAFHHHPRRLDVPTARGEETSWDDALADVSAAVSAAIATQGPDSVGMYLASGSAYDALGRRAAERFLRRLGSRQKYTATTVDTPSKPLVAQLVGGWTGLTPLWDHRRSKLLVIFGSNPVVSHGHSNAMSDPVTRLRQQRERGEVWVLDPRRTETARLADRHLVIRPGTDHHVLGWLVRALLRDGADREYLAARATGVEAIAAAVEVFTTESTVAATGLGAADLDALLAAVRDAGQVSAMTGTGVSMGAHANVTEWLLWVLHIVTASYDRPGGMWFNPGVLMQLDGRDGLGSPDAAEPGPDSRPELPRRFGEYPCAGLVDEIEAGNLRVLFVVGGNPMIALPETDRLARALASLDALVVLDVVETDTTELATHVLPVAGQLERADVPWMLDAYQLDPVTQYTDRVVPVGASRRPMWSVFDDLAVRLGLAASSESSEAEQLEKLIAGAAVDHDALRRDGVAQLDELTFGWVHDRILPDGRWRLAPTALVEQLRALPNPPPSVLVPRRQLGTMNSQLRSVTGEACVIEVASSFGVSDGEEISVSSAHGTIEGVATLNADLAAGVVSIPHGWSAPNVGRLTSAAAGVDPLTGMVVQSGLEVEVRRLGS